MKFAETPIQKNQFIYLKDDILEILEAEPGDVLEWYYVKVNGEIHKAVKKRE